MNEFFHRIAQRTSEGVGSPKAFMLAVVVVISWAVTGPLFGYSDTWQLIINTGTTILTFLMVFLIQNTQNRDNRAIHLKLDELIRSVKTARNRLIDIEDHSDADLAMLQNEFIALSNKTELLRQKRAARRQEKQALAKEESL